jgi:hypothetical protein
MKRSNIILALAGTLILASFALGTLVSPNWYWFTAFVGLTCSNQPLQVGV